MRCLFFVVSLIVSVIGNPVEDSRITQIVNGTPSLAQRPFFVRVTTRHSATYCGGAIIERRWILTASHCVFEFPEKDILVEVGDFTQADPTTKTYTVDTKIALEKRDVDGQTINDIALLKLRRHLPRYLRFLPLCALEREHGSLLGTCGLGSLNPVEHMPPLFLQNTFFLSSGYHSPGEACRRENVCTLPVYASSNLCFMDDGNPLWVVDCSTFNPQCLYGVASYYLKKNVTSENSCDGGSVFASVPRHYNWIRTNIALFSN